ncbi:hypothetical protein SORBI_3008G094150 [Sorghum bicolor]|uniref:Uncharacterized protein n=2 Tax=Sorghum bicolor TaxID=4558 RepID=A0A1Z5R5Q0_SORBI|nr:hypothetical protein SORBI_3008G094150 [Sorghum bicolor]
MRRCKAAASTPLSACSMRTTRARHVPYSRTHGSTRRQSPQRQAKMSGVRVIQDGCAHALERLLPVHHQGMHVSFGCRDPG